MEKNNKVSVNVECGKDLTYNMLKKILKDITEKLDPETNVEWGANVNEKMKNKVKVEIVYERKP